MNKSICTRAVPGLAHFAVACSLVAGPLNPPRCVVTFNSERGIAVSGDSLVAENMLTNNAGAAIRATGGDNRLESNNCTSNGLGFDVIGAGNIIVRNTCSGNTNNWAVSAGNYALVVSATSGGIITGNSGGASLGSTDPNANFTY